METNNKYYTPSIEEFHVGFEYEYRTQGNEWEKDILLYDQVHSNKLDTIRKMLQNELNEIRIKYLDKEDIQSFKFKTQDGKEHIHETDDLLFFVIWNGKDEFGITYNKKEHYIKTIKHFSGLHNMNECWMPINIKNKSELKILLEQLNIYQNVSRTK